MKLTEVMGLFARHTIELPKELLIFDLEVRDMLFSINTDKRDGY